MTTVTRVIPKRPYDFTQGGGTVVVSKALDVTAASSGSLLLRVHEVDVSSGGQIDVVVRVSAPSDEDPQIDFTGPVVATATIDDTTTAPSLIKVDLAEEFGGFLWLEVVGTQGAGTTLATISADLAMKA